ncbi:hypothetical protein AURDEDRAFT_188092 [Auricularia subglabra TFB-10046 SS5]|uniref:Low temperature requirement A n=1 Tax=Auricularia subglabra (strain TFB-10046 / SS5) TaxID=717982 RepID=J0WVR1_AURST|nr:hypothetical protein AURDEDRAFT_188092 [Auricularia subglabra TFB-10046 SS5]
MVALQKLLRSFTREPDPQSAEEIRVVPLSETPFVGAPKFDLTAEDEEKLERIAPSPPRTPESASLHKPQAPSYSESASAPMQLPLLSHAYPPRTPPAAQEVRFPEPVVGLDAVALRERKDENAESTETGPPDWLGIFFDLAWTTTFSNLTSNTELTTFSTLLSYAVFFILAWWLWAAQVSYDTKFYTNDWFHRAMLMIQLTIFGTLSAFTKDFNPFSTMVDPRKAPLEDFVKFQYARKSMLGISGLFAATRLFLVISYARVFYYLRKGTMEQQRQRNRILIQIGTYITSCLLFAGAFLVVKYNLTPASVWARLLLWLGGVGSEVLVFLFVPDVDGRQLRNVDTMGERLSSLTTIILGEGLNSLAGTLVLAASAIGFSAQTGGVSASATLVITFAFLLYFDGFKRRTLSMQNRSKLNILLHFPLHLAIIVLLEALKNTLVYSSLIGTTMWFLKRAEQPKGNEDADDAVVAAFRNVGIDFEKVIADGIRQIRGNNFTGYTQEQQDADINELVNKAFAQVFLNIFENFELADDDMRANFTTYIQAVGGAARSDDIAKEKFALEGVLDAKLADVQASALWIPLAAGAFLASLAFIAIVNAWVPKHRYIWASVLARAAMAVVVALLTLLRASPATWKSLQDQGLLGALVAVSFVTQFAVDHILIWFAVRRRVHWRRVASFSST